MGSGKTYAANELSNRVQAKTMSISKPIKEIVSDMGHTGRASHIMVGTVGRQINRRLWIDKMMERIDKHKNTGTNIVVDDVRFENEAKTLKDAGFTLVYLDMPWHVRFQRIRERTDDLNEHIQWFAHPSEVALETVDKSYFDFICKKEEDVDSVIEDLSKKDTI
jgi:dephospho-CoA kinase